MPDLTVDDKGIIFFVFFLDIANFSHINSPLVILCIADMKEGNLTSIHILIIPHNSSSVNLHIFANLDEYSSKNLLLILGIRKPGSKQWKLSIPKKLIYL